MVNWLKNNNKSFGKVQMFSERVKMYLSWIQFFLVAYTAISLTNLSIWIFIIGAPLFFLFMVFDWYVLLPQTLGVAFDKNPEWQVMLDRLGILEGKVDSLLSRGVVVEESGSIRKEGV